MAAISGPARTSLVDRRHMISRCQEGPEPQLRSEHRRWRVQHAVCLIMGRHLSETACRPQAQRGSKMRNAPFEVRPIAGAIGAELHGVDLGGDLSDATVAAIRQALLDHLVIFFRDQDLPPERFLALARRFGTPIEYPFVQGVEGFPEIINVAKLEHETVNFGGVWHADTTYLQQPPMATLLVAREVPEVGGDTLFANQYLAYEALSGGMKALLADLKGISSSLKADASRTREDRVKSDG